MLRLASALDIVGRMGLFSSGEEAACLVHVPLLCMLWRPAVAAKFQPRLAGCSNGVVILLLQRSLPADDYLTCCPC